MNKLAMSIDQWRCKHSRKYKLKRICKVLGITPYPWQRDFALGKTDVLGGPSRATGKTMAVMLRVALSDPRKPAPWGIFNADPDYIPINAYRMRWYVRRYRELSMRCMKAGIFVPLIQENHI